MEYLPKLTTSTDLSSNFIMTAAASKKARMLSAVAVFCSIFSSFWKQKCTWLLEARSVVLFGASPKSGKLLKVSLWSELSAECWPFVLSINSESHLLCCSFTFLLHAWGNYFFINCLLPTSLFEFNENVAGLLLCNSKLWT